MEDDTNLPLDGADVIQFGPFIMPDFRSPLAQRKTALTRLNAIKLTVEQYERGMSAFRAGGMAGIEEYCRSAGFEPADVAANAIVVRWESIDEAMSEMLDYRTEHAEQYRHYVEDPTDPILLGLLSDGTMIEEDEDDDRRWPTATACPSPIA